MMTLKYDYSVKVRA